MGVFDDITEDINEEIADLLGGKIKRNNMERHLYYVLVDGKIKPVSLDEYMKSSGGGDFIQPICVTDLRDAEYAAYENGDRLSTVFVGINMNWRGGEPILFETMLFGGEFDELQWRYKTLEEAQVGHELILRALRVGKEPERYDRADKNWLDVYFEMYTGEVE